jgi:ribosomal protein S18 acetylase RimI-like enzyme
VTPPFTIAPLAATHDRSGFDCGVPALDRYCREQLTQDIRRRVSNGFVATEQGGTVVVGFYTLAATGLPMTDLPPEEARRLPRYPLLPAVLIGRLAVARSVAGRGLGGALVVDALSRSIRAEPAVFAVIVDAKDEAAAAFYRHLGFRAFASRTSSLFLPLAEVAKRMAMRG